ncbi:Panacea domain-containing protein [Alkalimarinus coralli]|uniref:Panacea domain-containing protein n=1 Tax=Alkalimarinus coralli TaxID=2935863 RepID=UPI00202B8F7A|nr:Panacea domain-containing protein [Alkalimarinus coralli]
MGNLDTRDKYVKILEAFAYIATHAPKKNEYNVLKVFYLADKLHMERYGRFIFEDSYSAMPKGPVPSIAYDLIKQIRTAGKIPHSLTTPIQIQEHHKVLPLRDADEDVFSGSDLECIDEILELSANSDLGDLSHDDAWKQTSKNSIIPVELIISTLQNSDELLELHRNRHP